MLPAHSSAPFTGLLRSNVPGVACYFTGLSYTRTLLATLPAFTAAPAPAANGGSVLPKLTSGGNLLAGSATRVAVGVVLNPFTVLKARYEVCPPGPWL